MFNVSLNQTLGLNREIVLRLTFDLDRMILFIQSSLEVVNFKVVARKPKQNEIF